MAERLTEGVLLKADKTGIVGTTLTEIAELTSIEGPSESTDSVEKTPLASGTRRFRAGLHDPGEVSFELMFDPGDAEHLWLRGLPKAKTTHAWQILLPGEGSDGDMLIEFNAFATEFSTSFAGPGELVTSSVTLKIDGDVTYTEDEV